MNLAEFVVFAFSSLWVVVNPVAMVPAFIAMTPNDGPAQQLRMARLACTVAGGVLASFALAGPSIFRVLGITLPAFQIAGSILLFRIALDMLYARRSGVRETHEEVEAGAAKDDIAITPLAVPMLAGPGAISTCLILLNQADGIGQWIALFVSITAVCLTSYWVFHWAVLGARQVNPLVIRLVTRLMGLLLAAVAVQFAINGIRQAWLLDPGQ